MHVPIRGELCAQAARVAMGVELRPMLKSLDAPSNPKVAVIAMEAGLRATAKGVDTAGAKGNR